MQNQKGQEKSYVLQLPLSDLPARDFLYLKTLPVIFRHKEQCFLFLQKSFPVVHKIRENQDSYHQVCPASVKVVPLPIGVSRPFC